VPSLRAALLAVIAVSGALLAARAWFGPLAFPLRVHSPMNLEGVFALSCVLLLALSSRTNQSEARITIPERYLLPLLAVFVLAAFAGALKFPLLADDYSHIWNARHADWQALWAHFTVPEPDRFFRPAVYWSYAWDASWAGLSPLAWRSVNLAIHIFNTLLVYLFCRELGLRSPGAFVGALIFGVHASLPEAVTWVGARFDLMSLFFGLSSLIAILRAANWSISCSLLALAILSKESAYAVPLLAAAVLLYRQLPWKKIGLQVIPLVAVAAVALAYRLWLLGGIGGYRDASDGSAVIFHMRLASELKALFPRFWAAMILPVNWTGGLSKPLAAMMALSIPALAYAAWTCSAGKGGDRRKIWLGITLATICSLPVHQFLSIGPDLEKSRVLYFPSIGLAMMIGTVFEPMDPKLLACAVALVAFQLTALESNLAHWRDIGELAARTCATAAEAAKQSGGRIAVTGLPNVVDGVYFLHTGFPECVKFISPALSASAQPIPGERVLIWDPASRTLH
jgi:hypothetical protein